MALPVKEVRELPRPIRRVISHPWSRWRRVLLTRKQRSRMRRFLNKHGHITPNFTWDEARSKSNPREPDGVDVPQELRANAIRHAWNLERVRHDVGDKPLGFLSWFRTPYHNTYRKGASQSRHMQADATDFDQATIARVGRTKLMAVLNRIFASGGVGDYPSGAVHCDSRGYRARWSSY